jgi:hypothetical protein
VWNNWLADYYFINFVELKLISVDFRNESIRIKSRGSSVWNIHGLKTLSTTFPSPWSPQWLLPVQWVEDNCSLRDADHSCPSSANIKNSGAED